jgi:hypothetical protein
LAEEYFVEPHDIDVFNTIEGNNFVATGEFLFCIIIDDVAGTLLCKIKMKPHLKWRNLAVDKKFRVGIRKLLVKSVSICQRKKASTIMLMSVQVGRCLTFI